MYSTLLLLAATAIAADEPTTIQLTELYEHYEYDYMSDDDEYGEKVVWAVTAEVQSKLSNGMTGWTYIGFLHITRITWYGNNEDIMRVWWSNAKGDSDTELSKDEAVRRLLASCGYRGDWVATWK